MRKLFIFLSSLVLISCTQQGAQAAPETQAAPQKVNWTVDKTKTTLSFTASQSGEDFTGKFSRFDVQINFDPDDLPGSSVIAIIDLVSADAGDKERTEALPGKDWFFVKSFPKARFGTSVMTHLGGDKYEAKAILTLRGIEKSIILPFTLVIENGHAKMQAALTLNRSDFKVGGGMWDSEDYVSYNVGVKIKLEADKLN